LQARLSEISDYLQGVINNELPVDHQIIYNLQDIFDLLPITDLSPITTLQSDPVEKSLNGDDSMSSLTYIAAGAKDLTSLVLDRSRPLTIVTKDQLLVLYLSSLI
ncbi:uncharacterized protein MELLADRAFT_38822, partial [Melampsora larici-populina 98AG31]